MPRDDTERLCLMCKDHVAVVFTWDYLSRGPIGRHMLVEPKYLPYGCIDRSGHFSKASLSLWLRNRAIPDTRPHAARRLKELGIDSPLDALTLGFGLSLSDQYWLKPIDSSSNWADVNCFTNDFPEELAELLLPHGDSSLPDIVRALRTTPSLMRHSPDVALNGNLPKRWKNIGGERWLVKSGREGNRLQEPFNEVICTELCARLLNEDEYVSYVMDDDEYPHYTSRCRCMVDEDTEFVPAIDIYESHAKSNSESFFDYYLRVCGEHGIDVSDMVKKMLVVDELVANFDRHWNNFGVLVDSETREWLSAAPIFDTGESLWCDRAMSQGFGPYKMARKDEIRPFSRDISSQVEHFCAGIPWYDESALNGFAEVTIEILRGNVLVAFEPDRLNGIRLAVEDRIAKVGKLARRGLVPGVELGTLSID